MAILWSLWVSDGADATGYLYRRHEVNVQRLTELPITTLQSVEIVFHRRSKLLTNHTFVSMMTEQRVALKLPSKTERFLVFDLKFNNVRKLHFSTPSVLTTTSQPIKVGIGKRDVSPKFPNVAQSRKSKFRSCFE